MSQYTNSIHAVFDGGNAILGTSDSSPMLLQVLSNPVASLELVALLFACFYLFRLFVVAPGEGALMPARLSSPARLRDETRAKRFTPGYPVVLATPAQEAVRARRNGSVDVGAVISVRGSFGSR